MKPSSYPTRALRLWRMGVHLLRGLLLLAGHFRRLAYAERAVVIQRWSRHLLKLLGVEVRVFGTPPGLFPPNTLLVSNHVSWLDIFALNSVSVSRFVAKQELRDWPVIGWLIKNSGTLFIDRSNRRDASRVNEQLASALNAGGCMAVFPEGTTTTGDVLLPFKASLFESVLMSGGTVQPLALRYTWADGSYCAAPAYAGDTTFWESLRAILAAPKLVVELHFGEPLQAGSAGLSSRFELADAARSAVAGAFNLPDAPPDRLVQTPFGPPAAAR